MVIVIEKNCEDGLSLWFQSLLFLSSLVLHLLLFGDSVHDTR